MPPLKARIHLLVQRATDFLLEVCFASGNLPSSLESGHADRLVHWCHGAPGFVHLLAHAHRVRHSHSCIVEIAEGISSYIQLYTMLFARPFVVQPSVTTLLFVSTGFW